MGIGVTDNVFEPTLSYLFGNSNFVQACAGYSHTLALNNLGVVFSVGGNSVLSF